MFSQQARHPPRPQYILAQQQSVASGHSLPPQYHQQPAVEQVEAELQTVNPVQQQQQQQQHYMMEQQQMASRMPANAHPVERPTMMPQVFYEFLVLLTLFFKGF
ncbi:unnamed protein product [Enterobius vermicularis]|uniref:Cyclin-dependent serine/threonine-protein kinase DDB_G0272797/DDB_G0274007 n=1 Tax=Enterobius vermicularis TaxID=51028 RepID=A0A0N4V309_ENTVE|nr:unnamed protein product [Enterobius vermicularis]